MDTARRNIIQIVETMFPLGSDAARDFHKHKDDAYLNVLNEIHKCKLLEHGYRSQSLMHLLYAGCLKFDRWTVPTPYVHDRKTETYFSEYLKALIMAEGGSTDNTLVFQLRNIKNELFRFYDSKPVDSISNPELDRYRTATSDLGFPSHPIKIKEYTEELNKIGSIVDGIKDNSLQTVIRTRIPYVIHMSSIRINFNWNGIRTTVLITPVFEPQRESFFKMEPAGIAMGASRWQGGISTIELTFSALIDCDSYTESLQLFDQHQLPVSGWPKAFTLAFGILHDVCWFVRVRREGTRQWIPAPRDLSDVYWFIRSKANQNIVWKQQSSPAALFHVFKPSGEAMSIDIDEIPIIPWSERCRHLASMYLELGETNESLFWLNVGVEALVKERIIEFSYILGRPDLERDVDSPRAFWGPAEDIVLEQFPELSGKIKWPESQIHVSIYGKIKYLSKMVNLKSNIKDIILHYSNISGNRNALFHGTLEERIKVDVVKEAFSSFDWLKDNFVLAEKSNGAT